MQGSSRDEITDLLVSWSGGDHSALAPLMDVVYQRLVRIAASHLRVERGNHTLDASSLVHEAFLRLVRQDRVQWHDRVHFFSVAAKLMRRVLLDHARRRTSLKRGRDALVVPLEDAAEVAVPRHPNLLALDDALRELEAKDTEAAALVEMRYFGGMNHDEVAQIIGVSSATVARRWRTVRAWLYEYLEDAAP